MPDVCPRCGSSEITVLADRSGRCRRCSSAFMEPKAVDAINLIPFDQIMAPSPKRVEVEAERQKPEWRRSLEPSPATPKLPASATTRVPPFPVAHSVAIERKADWGLAIFYGIVASIVMGVVWGLIAVATGYIFTLLAIAVGLVIAFAVSKGAGTVNIGLIVLTVILTLVAVFIGDVIALTIMAGASMFDVIAAYPTIMTLAPGDICLGYVFGLFGAAYGAYHLWQQRSAARARSQPIKIPTYVPSSTVPGISTSKTPNPSGGGKPSVHVLANSFTRAHVQVRFESTVPHTLEVEYETYFGNAAITVDGVQVFKARVWGSQKTVDVPFEGSSTGSLRVRFHGVPRPHIEVTDGASVVVNC